MILSFEHRKRSAFTLVEMLVVMAALGMCLFLGVVLVVTTLKADHAGEAAANRVSRRAELSRQFRDDVSRAEAAPDKFADEIAGPQRLILKIPGGATVIYACENDSLQRSEWINQKEKRQTIPLSAGTTVEFARPATKAGLATLRITERTAKGSPRRSEISASLGGDLR